MACRCDGYPNPNDEHNGPVAEMLCKAMKEHEARGEMSCFNAQELEWWRVHKERDRQRIAQDLERAAQAEAKAKRDKDRADLIDKMTPYEREILGFHKEWKARRTPRKRK